MSFSSTWIPDRLDNHCYPSPIIKVISITVLIHTITKFLCKWIYRRIFIIAISIVLHIILWCDALIKREVWIPKAIAICIWIKRLSIYCLIIYGTITIIIFTITGLICIGIYILICIITIFSNIDVADGCFTLDLDI